MLNLSLRNKWSISENHSVDIQLIFNWYSVTDEKVKIDNIRITDKRLKTPNTEDAMTAGSVKSVDGTPVVSAELKVTDTEINNVMFVATAYNKDTGAFVTFDNRIFNLQTYKTAKVNFKLDEITDYSSDKYLIKVMAIDKLTLQPVGEALEL